MERDKEWTRKEIISLLKTVRNYPCIWNVFTDDHKNKGKKAESYREIAMMFGCSKDEIERKLTVLRSGYRRELRKEHVAKAAGIQDYKTKWVFYKHMDFLHPDNLEALRKTALDDNLEEMDENSSGGVGFENEGHHSDYNSSFSLLRSDHLRKRKKNENCDYDVYNDKQFLKEATELLKSVRESKLQSENQDEFDRFGASIAAQLRNLKSSYARASAKLNIQKALFESEQMDMHISSPSVTNTQVPFVSVANSKTTFPSYVTTTSNPLISNKSVPSDQNLTTLPIINKKLGPRLLNTSSPSNEFPQTQHFLICKKT